MERKKTGEWRRKNIGFSPVIMNYLWWQRKNGYLARIGHGRMIKASWFNDIHELIAFFARRQQRTAPNGLLIHFKWDQLHKWWPMSDLCVFANETSLVIVWFCDFAIHGWHVVQLLSLKATPTTMAILPEPIKNAGAGAKSLIEVRNVIKISSPTINIFSLNKYY